MLLLYHSMLVLHEFAVTFLCRYIIMYAGDIYVIKATLSVVTFKCHFLNTAIIFIAHGIRSEF